MCSIASRGAVLFFCCREAGRTIRKPAGGHPQWMSSFFITAGLCGRDTHAPVRRYARAGAGDTYVPVHEICMCWRKTYVCVGAGHTYVSMRDIRMCRCRRYVCVDARHTYVSGREIRQCHKDCSFATLMSRLFQCRLMAHRMTQTGTDLHRLNGGCAVCAHGIKIRAVP